MLKGYGKKRVRAILEACRNSSFCIARYGKYTYHINSDGLYTFRLYRHIGGQDELVYDSEKDGDLDE